MHSTNATGPTTAEEFLKIKIVVQSHADEALDIWYQ
jgi:hypothetical protein